MSEHLATRFKRKQSEQDYEHEKREDLKGQTAQENVVRCRGIFSIRGCDTDQRSSEDLHNSRDNVASDEDPEDELGFDCAVLQYASAKATA
jgi:hypothetical protein